MADDNWVYRLVKRREKFKGDFVFDSSSSRNEMK
jgi:hypothetical protein